MPIHTIIGSDGKTYNVNVPEGITQEQAAAKLMSKLSTKPFDDQRKRRQIGALGQGLTWGSSDELSSGLAAGIAKVTGDKRPYKDIYSDIHQTEQEEQNRYARENPGENLALQGLGSVATGGLTATRLLPSAVAASKTARTGVLVGESAIAGAASANPGDRLEGAALGAVTGGVIGGAGELLGAVGRGASNQRIATPLRQPDGSFVPINVADNGNPLGEFYQNFLGRTWGAGKKLQHQTQQLIDPLKAQADDAVRNVSVLKETLGKQEEAVKRVVKAATKQGIKRVQSRVPQFERLHAEAAVKSLPEGAGVLRQEVAQMRPDAARKVMRKWWGENGFNEIKGQTFAIGGGISSPIEMIRKELQDNPTFRLEMGDVAERISGLAQDLKGTKGKPITLDGESLMAIRNAFAVPSNKASEGFRKMAQRGVASKIDEAIIAQSAPDVAQRFLDEKEAYKTWAIYRDAAKKGFKAKQGRFDENDWLSAVEKRIGPDPDAYLVNQARATQEAKEAADQTVRQIKENKPTVLKRAVEKVGKKGKVADAQRQAEEAKSALVEMAKMAPNPNATGLSEFLTTRTLGSTVIPDNAPFGLGKSALATAMAGSGVASGLTSKTGQELVAGQLAWQRALAEHLRENQKTYRDLGRGAARYGAINAGDEQ